MNVIKTDLAGVVIIEPRVLSDARGYFFESFQMLRYQQHGIAAEFVQDNLSYSVKNVVRGLHYQLEHAQGKLVFVTKGKVLDVVVDVRLGSPTFGKSITVELDDVTHRQIYIPPGYAHGFCVLSEMANVLYKCTEYYHPTGEHGIIWNDADLAIAWPLSQPILSEKDKNYPSLKQVPPDQLPRFVTS